MEVAAQAVNAPAMAAAPASSSSSSSTPSTSFEGSYAFLVHSQDSVSHNAAPEVDNRRLARQKRRRTSPEDHAVLEAEYQKNPKPDKRTRQEIVGRVALGEKEVQIWFQNRRQLARRRSQPMTQDRQSLDSCSSMEDATLSRQDSLLGSQGSSGLDSPQELSSDAPASPGSSPNACRSAADKSLEGSETDSQVEARPALQAISLKIDTRPKLTTTASSTPLLPKPDAPSYLANRRSASLILPKAGTTDENAQPGGNVQKHAPRRSLSMVKLTMDENGKAEVTSRTGATPSPAKREQNNDVAQDSQDLSDLGLRRSHSAMEFRAGGSVAWDPSSPAFRVRQTLGRSRDTRTWEFYCDSSARDELTKQAEGEESGSAAAAIGLLKSRTNNSSSSSLTLNNNKRNAIVQKSRDPMKRTKMSLSEESRPKMSRAKSSIGRLQSTAPGHTMAPRLKDRPSKSLGGSKNAKNGLEIYEDHDGDSDKENWEPGTTQGNEHWHSSSSLRQAHGSHVRSNSARILLESQREPSQTAAFKRRRSAGNKSSLLSQVPVDEEVASFMGEQARPRDEDEMACVQNLLRLSQAAWT